MVKIIYYADPSEQALFVGQFENVSEFLLSRFTTRDQLLDLRFFNDDLLGVEVDQSHGDFLDICEGTIAITHDSMIPRDPATWGYVLVAVLFAAVAIILQPSIPTPTGRDQQSGTNRLGSPSNEARINQRIDDIFGTVNKHTPPLWQVPYRIGVNNQETEVLYLCVGRGKYQMFEDKWYDGNTPIINIPNASVSAYGPYTHPGSGVPVLQIGELVTEKIGIYRESNDLNRSELLPPNELSNNLIQWSLTGSGASGILEALSMPDGFKFDEFYQVGQIIDLSQMVAYSAGGTVDLYTYDYNSSFYNLYVVETITNPVNLGQGVEYEITNVTANTITVAIPVSAPTEIIDAWATLSNFQPPQNITRVISFGSLYAYTLNPYLSYDQYYERQVDTESSSTYYAVMIEATPYTPSATVPFVNGIGPIFTPKNATEIILNFVSVNGFYKLNQNSEVAISAQIRVTIYELDVSGDETGNSTPFIIDYESNPEKVRNSVFQTARLELPYTYSKVFAERLTNRDKTKEISNVDVIEWRDFYSFEPVNVTDFGDVTTAHIITPSNSQSQLVKDRKNNLDVTRLVTQYLGNGVFGPVESYPTNQADQILIHTALDERIGRLTLNNINADGFLSLRQQHIDYFGNDDMFQFGYDFDTTNLTYQDTFMLICDVIMCKPYVQAGVYDAFFERRQDTSSMQITCRNKLPDSETRKENYDQKSDGVEITYRDNATGASEAVYIPLDQSAINPDRKELLGCTSKVQALRYAYRMRNKQVYQYISAKFDVDEFGRNIIPGRRLDSPDSTRFTKRAGVTDGYRVYDGEVVEVSGLVVELSEPIEFTEGEDHYIVFTKENGDNSEAILCTYVSEFKVQLSTLPSESVYDGYSRDRTKFTFMSEQLRESVALIPETIEFSLDDNGSEVNTVSLTNYSANYYKDDLELPA